MKSLISVLVIFYTAHSLIAQLSPGELTRAHEKLEGLTKCTQCHVLGDKVTNEKCLDCHSEIKTLIIHNNGYHASDDVSGKDCISCHSEHHGRNFQMTRFDVAKFNHTLTGYQLNGKHAKLGCSRCHTASLIHNKISKKESGTYLGLETECLSCHKDYHRKTLSQECTSCHSFDSFSPAVRFDHSQTSFPLRGKHTNVACSECHSIEQNNGIKFQHFTGIAHNKCTDCHKDVHNNKFGQNCRKCHNEESFRNVANLNGFEHSKTRFPLHGKHRTVECSSCHKQSFSTPISYTNCTDCHSDYHQGQLKKPGVKYDCTPCHTVDSFEPSFYTIEQHNQTSFLLDGAHMATPCFECHKKNDRWEFTVKGERCTECHSDIHKDLISVKYYPGEECKKCHNNESWSDIAFDHGTTKFALSGEHLTTSCRSCHFEENGSNTIIQKFTGLKTRCENCHKDEHHTQFAENGSNLCERCHSPSDWEASLFNHDLAPFRLEGAHKNAGCIQCHPIISDTEGSYVKYKLKKDIKCADCHTSL